MKKYNYLLAFIALITASCADNIGICETCLLPDEAMTTVNLSFGTASLVSSRAIFNDTSEPEPWESVVNKLTIYAFDELGNWAETYQATKDQIAAGVLAFAIPSRLSNKEVTFYAVANYDVHTRPSRSTMDIAPDSPLSYYNNTGGTNGDFTKAFKYEMGYTMSAKQTVLMSRYGEPKNIHFELKRAVGKIAVRVKLHPRFFERYPAHEFVLTACLINNFIKRGYIMESESENTDDMTAYSIYSTNLMLTQDSGVDFLFYAGASGKLPSDTENKPLINVSGKLISPNGSSRNVSCTASFNTANDGEVKRNGYYRIEFGITGFNGTEFFAAIVTDDWSGSMTSGEDIGY